VPPPEIDAMRALQPAASRKLSGQPNQGGAAALCDSLSDVISTSTIPCLWP
jgi:hypothetical protein